ncbi:hypothetical protein RX327_20055 [Bradyrhizobium sp. BEA-2-5]|uniref:hypothetical protein n=1 Tax=Bradyrhizobium sp. BEA-2-5 TaxID=3080015 RepID=UPI00293EB935|nr:hypothetical protein [Bradyrhizobium sp. BEA-2-5]WOH78263.1 hypothetical protein RX327_20055 [Bradyrhizobium sp. BEA-2-5]
MAWQFYHFSLPDDHAFIYSVRGLVDGVFKVFGWLALAATFQVAAEATQSKFLWVICGIAYLAIFLYLQAFIEWLGYLKFNGLSSALRELRPGQSSKHKTVRRLSRAMHAVISFAIWAALVIGMQTVVEKSAAAIVVFQQAKAK